MSAATESVIVLRELTLAHRGHLAVDRLSGEFARGCLTAVVGPNGAGKTSLLSALGGALVPVQGEVVRHMQFQRRMAWLPQQTELDRSIPLSIADLVGLGAWARIGVWRALGTSDRRRLAAALETVGLSGMERRRLGEISAGQLQRALFARVLMQDAQLILLDEPFNAIDARTTADLLQIVRRWHAEGRTQIAVLHDLDQVREHFPECLLLARRCIAWGPTNAVLTDQHLAAARQASESWDDDAVLRKEAA